MITTKNGNAWFANNLNQGHLDYFYWLLADVRAVALTCTRARSLMLLIDGFKFVRYKVILKCQTEL
jgi:hypothetical protein